MRLSSVTALALLVIGSSVHAQDLPTTHDHGITITPDHLTGAIQETSDFWGPVRKHLLSTECSLGDVETRTAALTYLKQVHDGLHDRLFQQTEVEAMDLIHFLGHRLRSFEVYRRLRATLADDALMLTLMETYQKDLRAVNQLPVSERAAKLQAMHAKLVTAMQSNGIAGEKLAAASQLWDVQTQISRQIAETGAGKMTIEFEGRATQLDTHVGGMLLHITTAADWVLVIRTEGEEIGRNHFLKASSDLEVLHSKQTAAATGNVTR